LSVNRIIANNEYHHLIFAFLYTRSCTIDISSYMAYMTTKWAIQNIKSIMYKLFNITPIFAITLKCTIWDIHFSSCLPYYRNILLFHFLHLPAPILHSAFVPMSFRILSNYLYTFILYTYYIRTHNRREIYAWVPHT
jgi:hypothetical protein